MSKNINARIALKRDTSANWTNHNPVLLNGELILVDTAEGQLRAKIGDGIKTYTQLPFTDEALRALITEVDNNNSAVVVTKNGESRLLDTFNIVKLTQEEYEELEASNSLNPDALYLTEGEDNQKADTAISYTPQTLTEEQQNQARTNIGALDVNVGTTPVDIDVTLFGRGENIVYVKDGWLRPCPTDADTELVKAYRRLAVQIGGQSTEPIPTAILATASGIYLLYQNGLTSANAKIMPTLLNENRYAIWTISTNNSKHYVSFSVYGVAYSHFCKYCVEDNALVDENFSRAIYSTSTGVGAQTNVKQFRMSAAPTEDMHIATKQYVDTAKTEAQQLGLTAATPGQIIKVKTVQDGKPTEWEAVDMPGGVQSDWNQNDSTQPDYVKNRPFYTGNPVETVLVEESTVTFAAVDGMYMGQLESTFSATIGETYKVSWDGAAYECTCVNFNDTPAIGNLSIAGAGSDTGEPFVMGILNGERIQIATADTSASHTFSISRLVTVVKIDAKYLPNTVATKSEVEAAQTTANNAQTTANNAQTTANNAQTTANNAQTTANNAQTTANNAKSEALDLAARMFGYTSVVDNAFYKDTTLSITSLPACIESIGNSAFYGCINLALTSLPSGITSIGYSTFYNCKKLALTSLPSGLTSIGFSTFYGCTNLALTSLPSGITSIGNNAFQGCKNLALTSLPSGITSIGSRTFYDCKKLALTSLPSGLTSIGEYAFYDCFNLALTSLPSGLTNIVAHAFLGCTGLTSITFTGKPTTISSLAFEGCPNLTTINVPWAEGEVAGAPWGATNATINYGYAG